MSAAWQQFCLPQENGSLNMSISKSNSTFLSEEFEYLEYLKILSLSLGTFKLNIQLPQESESLNISISNSNSIFPSQTQTQSLLHRLARSLGTVADSASVLLLTASLSSQDPRETSEADKESVQSSPHTSLARVLWAKTNTSRPLSPLV